MLTNVISYRGYHGEIKYDPSADAFHARVLGMRDVISFYGRTPDELRQEMQAGIEDYLAWCEADGAKPEKSWTGKLTLRSGRRLPSSRLDRCGRTRPKRERLDQPTGRPRVPKDHGRTRK